MTFYSGLAAVATRLLDDKGQTVTFSRETVGSFDPVTGIQGAITATTWAGSGAAFNYRKSEVDGEVIRSTDIRLIVEAVTTEPAQGDTCTVDGVVYRVQDVTPSSPGGTVTHYTIQLRR